MEQKGLTGAINPCLRSFEEGHDFGVSIMHGIALLCDLRGHSLRLVDDARQRLKRLQGGVDCVGHAWAGEVKVVRNSCQVIDKVLLQQDLHHVVYDALLALEHLVLDVPWAGARFDDRTHDSTQGHDLRVLLGALRQCQRSLQGRLDFGCQGQLGVWAVVAGSNAS